MASSASSAISAIRASAGTARRRGRVPCRAGRSGGVSLRSLRNVRPAVARERCLGRSLESQTDRRTTLVPRLDVTNHGGRLGSPSMDPASVGGFGRLAVTLVRDRDVSFVHCRVFLFLRRLKHRCAAVVVSILSAQTDFVGHRCQSHCSAISTCKGMLGGSAHARSHVCFIWRWLPLLADSRLRICLHYGACLSDGNLLAATRWPVQHLWMTQL